MAARNGTAPKFGTPSGRFLELSQKINRVEPYEVTDQLVVHPPTRGRRVKMTDAENRMVVAQAQLNVAYALSRVPSPPLPTPPAVRDTDTTPEGDEEAAKATHLRREDVKAAADAEYKRDLTQWKQELAQWRENLQMSQRSIAENSAAVRDAEADYWRAYLGDSYERLLEFFDEQPDGLWDEFISDLQRSWVPSQPDDGTCPACGHVDDEETAGKDVRSLTG